MLKDINYIKNGIYYALYDKLYMARSQANCMAHVFEEILHNNPHQVTNALFHLKCLSETDYSALHFIQTGKSSLPPYAPIPASFRTCKIFEVKGQKLCLGTSYSEKVKLKYIDELILLCEEPHDIFVYRIGPAKNALCVDARYRQAVADPQLKYRLFNKQYSANQSEFMAQVFEECFKLNPNTIDWALENLDCLYEKDTEKTFKPKWKATFHIQRTLYINGRELVMGTSLGLADKLNRIDRYLRACGFDLSVYELMASPAPNIFAKLDSRQQQAIEAVSSAVRNMKSAPEIGYVYMVSGSGVTAAILGTVQSLRAKYPDKWAYLLVTDTIAEREHLIQELNRYQIHYHEAESNQALVDEVWESNSITVSAIQKFLPKDDRFTFSVTFPLQDNLQTTDKPVLVIFCNTRSLSAKRRMTVLRDTFTNGKYLAFCTTPPDDNEYSWFKQCLYSYSLEEAVHDGLLLPVQIECKNGITVSSQLTRKGEPLNIDWFKGVLSPMLKTTMAQQDIRKIMVVCANIYTAAQGRKEMHKNGIDAYTITSNMHKDALNTAVKGFRHSQQAVMFVVDLWETLDVPELDLIVVMNQFNSKFVLLQLAAKVARPSPGKKCGKLMLFGISEELLASWKLPLTFERQGWDATLWNDNNAAFEMLFSELRNCIGNRSFVEAFDKLAQLRRLDMPRCKLLEVDLAFLFLPEKSLVENEEHWQNHKKIVAHRAAVWYALTGEVQRRENSNELAESPLQEQLEPMQDSPALTRNLHSQSIGEIFEWNMKRLLEELLTTDGNGVVITEFRRQNSGTQFGFDLRCTYTDPGGQICNCVFECKDVPVISISDVTGKLAQLRMSERPVHHWILVSPNGKISNDLDAYRPRLMREIGEGRYDPVQNVQLWTHEQNVEELFALIPEIYEYYYPGGVLNSQAWRLEQREDIVARWRGMLLPGLMLPQTWQHYLYNPASLLAIQEDSIAYEEIYGSHVPIRCIGDDGIPISGTAEEYILNWLNQPTQTNQMPNTLFVLGDFGDGKSYLTYSLSRRLTERFLEAPGSCHLPLRLLLSDLQQNVLPQDFLRLRLQQFGANLEQWRTLTENHQLLIILDGFDEMSSGMDLQTVEKNAVRLCAAVRLFSGSDTKVIITSRYPVFQSVSRKLTSNFTSYKAIRLLPIGFREKMHCLKKFAENNNCSERFRRLCATHDVLGLASKPLFLDMMKSILLDDKTVEPNNLSIYSSFTRGTLEHKVLFEREDILIDKEETFGMIVKILEEYALLLTQNPGYGITMGEFLQNYRNNGNESLARDIWESLTEPSGQDEEDAGNRITSRTLLKPAKNGYVFCHRSMQEYYTARGLCRLLREQPQKMRKYITDTDISHETTQFLATMLFEENAADTQKAQQNLTDMVVSTRGLAKNDQRAARLGSTALSLYYAAWKQIPAIDWQELVLNNAVLAGANLAGQNISGTSLRYANLDNVNITSANLSFCDLTGVRLDETKELFAVQSVDEDQTYLYALYGDGILRKWKNFYTPQYTVLSLSEQYTGMAASYGGVLLYSSKRLSFSATSADGIVPQGGIRDLKDSYIYEVNSKRMVYSQGGFLALYDLESYDSLFSGYPVEESTSAVLLGDERVLVYRDRDNVRIITPDAEGDWYETPIEGLHDTGTLVSLATVQIDNGTYLLCCGHNNGTIRLYRAICGSVAEPLEMFLLSETNIDYGIRAFSFQSPQMVTCAGQDGVLHIFNITEEYILNEAAQCKSTIQCEDCIVEGLEPRIHRDQLLAHGAKC